VAVFAHGEQVAKSERYPLSSTGLGRLQTAWFESAHRLVKSYPKQPYAYPDVEIDRNHYPVTKSIVARKPFARPPWPRWWPDPGASGQAIYSGILHCPVM